MANVADHEITSATARAVLCKTITRGKGNKPFWRGIATDDTLAVGYQVNPKGGAGKWFGRRHVSGKRYLVRVVGTADDRGAVGGIDYKSAAKKVVEMFEGMNPTRREGPITLAEAGEAYTVAVIKPKYQRAVRATIARDITSSAACPGKTLVAALTKTDLETWRAELCEKLIANKMRAIAAGSAQPDDEEEIERKAQDSTNRVINTFRAILNHAFADEANGIKTSAPWVRGLVAFSGVARARKYHWTQDEIARLVNSCRDRQFALLIAGGWLTGARYGECAFVRVEHFDATSGELTITQGKTGFRVVQLTAEATGFFARLCAGRDPKEKIFVQANGNPYLDNHTRPMKSALAAAGLDTRASFYSLRHSYISRAIEAEVPLSVIADNCGTSVRMIERNYKHILGRAKKLLLEKFAPRLINFQAPANQALALAA